jgi:ATP-dependent Clp protease protease subunit
MPIGVPRIIYCWGEELPAQWTDIYNFIFRRRMVFLMQYLDDELCNQICGLLINIHMEDRSKELERKEMENSGLFKSSQQSGTQKPTSNLGSASSAKSLLGNKKERSIEDLMISEEDLGIDENHMLERHTLQKISLEWLNWNAQFFDYSDEPYLFYLAELLSKDFAADEGQLLYNFGNGEQSSQLPKLLNMFQNSSMIAKDGPGSFLNSDKKRKEAFEVYSAFRLLSNLNSPNANDYSTVQNFNSNKDRYIEQFQQFQNQKFNSQQAKNQSSSFATNKFVSNFAQNDLFKNLDSQDSQWNSSQKALAQRQLRQAYKGLRPNGTQNRNSDYLNTQSFGGTDDAYMEYRDYYRKQTERTFQDEESKKVFMIINSFGGSVGNGITVHDALQFIKAGSMTLALGVAASAASLALAGGTIGERYVTEGCHVMIHQPEGGLTGQASDIWIDSQEIMKIRLDVAEIYSLSTYRPRHKILRDLDRDFYLTATETVYYGLADEIATNEVMHEIIEMTTKVWDYHESNQQRLLESRESAASGLDTQTQS